MLCGLESKTKQDKPHTKPNKKKTKPANQNKTKPPNNPTKPQQTGARGQQRWSLEQKVKNIKRSGLLKVIALRLSLDNKSSL